MMASLIVLTTLLSLVIAYAYAGEKKKGRQSGHVCHAVSENNGFGERNPLLSLTLHLLALANLLNFSLQPSILYHKSDKTDCTRMPATPLSE